MDLDIICSMEHEYGVYANRIEAHSDRVDNLINAIDEDLILFKQSYSKMFLKNGMLVYRDMSLLEIALPECLSPYEAICYDQAANKIIENTAKKTDVIVVKNNIEKQKRSFGCHENYFYKKIMLFSSKTTQEVYQNIYSQIAPFLLTRYIIIGNGNYSDDQYTLSQRISALLQAKSETGAPSTRSLFHRRDEDHCTNGLRIHITSGDSNISDFSNYLKIGMTSLILKMIEQEFIQQKFDVFDPMRMLDAINSDLTCQKEKITYRAISPSRWRKLLPFLKLIEKREHKTAIEIQEMYLDMAKKFVEKKQLDETVVKVWEYTLNALKNNPALLENKLDWMIKKKLIDGVENDYLKENINLQYHALEPDGFFANISKEMGVLEIAKEEDIEKALYEPPYSRALTRKQVVEALTNEKCTIKKIDWDSICFTKYNAPYKIDMNTPFYIPLNDEKLKPHINY